MKKKYTPTMFKANVYPRNPDRPELALLELSMVRGAHNGVAGFRLLRGLTNKRFRSAGRLQFAYPTARKRRIFIHLVRSRLKHVVVRRVR